MDEVEGNDPDDVVTSIEGRLAMTEHDSKVVPLSDRVLVTGRRAENVVLLLEELLASARSGEIVALAVAWVPPTGNPHTAWRVTEALHGWLLPGAVDVLHLRMVREIAPDDGSGGG